MKMLFSLLICFILICGCSSTAKKELPPEIQGVVKSEVDIITLSPELKYGGPLWLAEAKRRFKNPLIVIGHGNTIGLNFQTMPEMKKFNIWYQRNGDNIVSVESIARVLHHIYPERDIVLVICNPDHISINIDRVWYSKENVWVTPDRYIEKIFIFGNFYIPTRETKPNYGFVGSIEEFITTESTPSMPTKK